MGTITIFPSAEGKKIIVCVSFCPSSCSGEDSGVDDSSQGRSLVIGISHFHGRELNRNPSHVIEAVHSGNQSTIRPLHFPSLVSERGMSTEDSFSSS